MQQQRQRGVTGTRRGRRVTLLATLLVLCAAAPGGGALRLLEVRVPQHAVRDQPARLECHFDLEGEALYSVKWYKDGREFYRYLPRDAPPAQIFPVPGLQVDMSQSSPSLVQLTSVQLATSGRYRCEVSAEAPSFQTVSDHGEMLVVALPDEGPRISGGRPRYALGDTVRVNCTSGRSRPPAQLMWFINGEQAEQSQLRGPFLQPPVDEVDTEVLQAAILGLEFRVRARHFKKGDLKLKCLATIATVYWRSNEESVEGERPQRAPALPSRPGGHGTGVGGAGAPGGGSANAPASRADRVHATNAGSRRGQVPWHMAVLAATAAAAGAEAETKMATTTASVMGRRYSTLRIPPPPPTPSSPFAARSRRTPPPSHARNRWFRALDVFGCQPEAAPPPPLVVAASD